MRVILLHGKDTDPLQKWYPWLAQAMRRRGIRFAAPVLPRAENPRLAEWTATLDNLKPDADTILVGHSRGGVALLRWLEQQPGSLRVRRVILVATNSGFTHQMARPDESNHGFYTKEGYHFARLRQHCAEFFVLHSKDDQWVPFEHGVENAKGLHAKLLAFADRGHFGARLKSLPELLELILR